MYSGHSRKALELATVTYMYLLKIIYLKKNQQRKDIYNRYN